MKNFLCVLLTLLMLPMIWGCNGDDTAKDTLQSDFTDSVESLKDDETDAQTEADGKEDDEQVENNFEKNTYTLTSNTKGIKILGVRHLESDVQLNCDWTGSGLEMNIVHGGGDIEFFGNTTGSCYFRAYVDGVEKTDAKGNVYHTLDSGNRKIILKDVEAGEHTIKLIKVTGYTLARAELLSVTFAGTISEQSPADKDMYIEFVGDSISCGWGTIGSHGGTYTDQDGTLAYPLLVSDALNADYSVTALSGQGLLMGNPGMTEGYLYPSALRSKSNYFNFERKADVVVINIGTNDYNYRVQQGITEEYFEIAYRNFLKTVRQKNGEDCKILCLYNTMNNTWADALLRAVESFGGESAGVYVYKTVQTSGGAHPNIAQQKDLAVVITGLINTIIEE